MAIDQGQQLIHVPYWYAPFMEAYRTFLRDMEPVWSRTEAVVHDPVYGYAGTLDRAGLVQGVPVVVDIKSGEVPPSVGPQTAAYRRCLADAHRWQRACLQLRPGELELTGPDGEPRTSLTVGLAEPPV